MSATDRLLSTFENYITMSERADRLFIDYKFGQASEGQVHEAQRHAAEARRVHLWHIGNVDGGGAS